MNKAFRKKIALITLFSIIYQTVYPTILLAGGPSQTESSSFSSAGASDMVNLFSGDFSYNLPLLNIGGYPVNLSYSSGAGLDDESSWVGLGWTLNPGAVTRSMRGLPDDFKGDKIEKDFYIKPNNTVGFNGGASFEFAGLPIGLSASAGISYNNYIGIGFETSFSPSFSVGGGQGVGLNVNLGLSNSTMNGFGVAPQASLSYRTKEGSEGFNGKVGMGMNYNSIQGVKSLNYSSSLSYSKAVTEGNSKKTEYVGKLPSFSSNYSFASPTVPPPSELPLQSLNLSFTMKLGPSISLGYISGDVGGYVSSQFLTTTNQKINSYGYLYSQNSTSGEDLHDFNREKDDAFVKGTKALPITNYTYDVFNVSGQGVSGSYRPHRGDIPRITEKKNDVTGDGLGANGSYEAGVGPLAWHVGGNASVSWSSSYSGDWKDGAGQFKKLGFKKKTDAKHEPVYFKALGEMTVNQNQEMIDAFGGDHAMRMNLKNSTSIEDSFYDEHDQKYSISGVPTTKKNREVRSQLFSYLDAEEASKFGVEKRIKNYDLNNKNKVFDYQNLTYIHRDEGDRKSHHMSEVSIRKSDGFTYVYGIPAYNKEQNEVTFSTDDKDEDNDGIVEVNGGDKVKNGAGRDEYYKKTTIPDYAHSFLLTCVLSSDYRDSDGIDGPSEGDVGNYVLFNYSRVSENYDWRMPAVKDKAYFNEGMLEDETDNKANYISGKKEVWYLHSIEGKDDIALFYLKDRTDSKSNSGQKLKQLDFISLYPKQELRNYVTHDIVPTPTKQVHFGYAGNTNQLCKGFPLSGGDSKGKLTLEKVWFTYENSDRGRLNPYEFKYGEDDNGLVAYNPVYSINAKDRWGTYKENEEGKPNTKYPYATQNQTLADKYAASWNLSSIKLPTGGGIKVDYESDSYSYVQDRRTMELFNITGLGSDKNSDLPNNENDLYDKNDVDSDSDIDYYVYFALDGNTDLTKIKELYTVGKGGKDLAANGFVKFRFKIKLSDRSGFENVPGYAQIEDIGAMPDHPGYGYIKLVSEKLDGVNERIANPISKTAWNYTRMYRPRLVNTTNLAAGADKINKADNAGELVDGIISTVTGFLSVKDAFAGLEDLIGGIERRRFFPNSFGKTIQKEGSWIRLYNPKKTKLGGGHRVKKIKFSDNWSALSGSDVVSNVVNGFEYNYTTKESNGNVISSGIASYEPSIGGEENPFKQPEMFSENKVWAPSNDYIKERPFGEGFYPGPSIGYSKVTVKSINAGIIDRHGVGTTVNEFYTYKDFPVKAINTEAKYKENDKGALDAVLDFFDIKSVTEYTASQGVAVELNNMHGKQKKVAYFREGAKTAYSSVEYKYNRKPNGDLSNEVLVMGADQQISKETVGVDYDFVMDFRENTTISQTAGGQANVDGQIYPFIFPIVVVTIMALPIYSYEKVQFRSATTSKVINKLGILSETIVKDENSLVSTSNELYESTTGGVIVSAVKNEFDQSIYSFKKPAFWDYEEVGLAYENTGAEIKGALSNGVFSKSTDIFYPGDIVAINDKYGWVSDADGSLKFIDETGAFITEIDANIKILKSGKANQLGVYTESISTIDNPIKTTGDSYTFSITNVLSAEAVTLSDEWTVNCECGYEDGVGNPYLYGAKGSWRTESAWAYLSSRTQGVQGGRSKVDARKDGIYLGVFTPFRSAYDSVNKSAIKPWVQASRIVNYNTSGQATENSSANLIHSANTFGYGGAISTATAVNASSSDIGFDSFEDYNYSDCAGDYYGHFSFKGGVDDYTNENSLRWRFGDRWFWIYRASSPVKSGVSHSGKKSVRLPSGKGLKMKIRLNESYK